MKLLIAGDFCIRNATVDIVKAGGTWSLFGGIKDILRRHDVNVVNVECALTDSAQAVFKDGPNLKGQISDAAVLAEAGFNVALLANNHTCDYGKIGLKDTIDALKNNGFSTVGAGLDVNEAKATLMLAENIAIINVGENEFGATNGGYGFFGMDEIETARKISDAATQGKFVVVIVHGGNEYNPIPSPKQKSRMRFFANCGASAVIGGHPHCPQGMEMCRETPIFYSMGNFVFSTGVSRFPTWNLGYLVSLTVESGKLSAYEMIPYKQVDGIPSALAGDELKAFNGYYKKLSDIVCNDVLSSSYWYAWCSVYGKHRAEMLDNRAFLINSYNCEAHRELMADYFKNQEELDGGRYSEFIEKIKELQEFDV